MTILIAKSICLFLGILLTTVNIQRWYGGQTVSAISNILMAAGITGFIVLQWLI